MKKVTFAILAHVDAGKTTLSEAMLFHAGVIKKMGRVDKEDSFLDYDIQERKRGITIFSKEISFMYRESQMTFLDTPGHNDFSCEMERTLQVLDYAILVISAKDGIQAHTKTIWKLLQTYQIPTFIFVNKIDSTYSTQEQLLRNIQKELNENCFAIDENFYENISLLNDELLEKYLNQQMKQEDIQKVISLRQMFPIFFGSALKDEGVEEFMEALDLYTCQKEALEKRIQKDIDQGTRKPDVLARSVERLEMYQKLNTYKIDVSNKTIEEIVKEIIKVGDEND